jgi:O-antigen ligase
MKKIGKLIIHFMRVQPLMSALVLLIVFPPVGFCYMLVLGGKEIYRLLKDRKGISFDIVTILFLIMFLSTIGAALQQQHLSYLLVLLIIVCYYGVYLFSLHHNKLTQIKNFSWVVIFGGVYQYLFGPLNQLFFREGWTNNLVGYITGSHLMGFLSHNRLYGSAYNPNYSAFLLVLAMGFLLVEFLKAIKCKAYKRLFLYVPLFVVIVAGIFATGSRSGFGVLVVLIGIFLFRLSWRSTILSAVLILVNGYWLYNIIPRSTDINSNLATRTFIWKNSIDLILQYPQFGMTPMGFPTLYFNQTGHHAAHAHNIFLAFFADFGIIAGMVFVGLTITIIFNLLKLLRYHRRKALFDWFLFSIPILGLTGLLDFPLSSPQVALPALVLVGMWQQYIVRTNHSFKLRQALLQEK